MKQIKIFSISIISFCCILSALTFQGCDPDDDCSAEPQCDTCVMLYKPNIYIYPTKTMALEVNLNFPLGGHVVTSIPEYNTGWQVTVDTNGLIDDTYHYLFYESTQPDVWQTNEGWVLEKENLSSFFRTSMQACGFAGREINDFIEYWIPKLNDFPYYAIYPQTVPLINTVVQLSFSVEPERILRLFYLIEGYEGKPAQLETPSITSFEREGFFVTEWGVILN